MSTSPEPMPIPVPVPFSWADQERHLVSHLSALIRLDTSNPPGNEIAVARYLSHQLSRADITHTVLESEPGRANLVARLPGSGQKPPLMLLSHADVVGTGPPEGWSRPPFSGEVADGRVWGRGALDMKGQVAAHRFRLTRDVLMVVTADEEAGSRLGAYWLWEHHRGLVEAELAFNEGGGQRFMTPGGPVYTVQVAEKGSARMRVTARGPGGHASVPRAESAVFTLAEALLRLRAFAPESVLHPASRRMLRTLADLHPGAGAEAIGRLLKEPTWAGAHALPIDPVLREFVVTGLLGDAVAAHEPGARVLPYINPAATDARAFPETKVVGFFSSAGDADIMRLIHAPDEHARISDLMLGGSCLLDAVLRFAT
ncbi:M20/M25/M40 family metallo-hydrolase [Streptomyces sp. NPDC026092]|uniref:M20/M25/M40 family metallo-hydrolase n=1 Tax=Streptomyces sp. NPDC026092 TaxID=3154797 RepID=UPI0033EFCAB1